MDIVASAGHAETSWQHVTDLTGQRDERGFAHCGFVPRMKGWWKTLDRQRKGFAGASVHLPKFPKIENCSGLPGLQG